MKNQIVRCADVLDIRDGTHDSPKYILEGYPLITSKNLKEGTIDFENVNYISRKEFEKINLRSRVDNGDILMPMIGTIGNPVIVNTDREFAIKNVALFKFCQDSKFINRYICYALKSPLIIKQLNSNKRGGTQAFVSLGDIRNLEIPNVDISEQKKISDVLDKAQDLIDKRKEQIAACDELIKSLFYHMFGDPVSNAKKWGVETCKKISSKIGSGATPSGGNSNYKKTGISLIRSMNIHNNSFVYNDLAYIDNVQAEKLNNVSIYKNDVLINITGASVARCCIVPHDILPARVNQHVSIIRCNTELIYPIFLCHMFTNENYQKLLWKVASNGGATREAITKQQLESLNIIIPPINLQNDFVQKVEKIEQQKQLLEQSLTELENNFNSLMQRAFKGELF